MKPVQVIEISNGLIFKHYKKENVITIEVEKPE